MATELDSPRGRPKGDKRERTRAKLLEAQSKDPTNPYIKNNLDLLDESFAKAKSVQ